ncbi:hypothetical protein [Asticcacaulis sp.]|uniref:hypothetical protein n=1 Tax=Asticcacaulis sp. TaxID=1872648 RepID=UPI003F7B6A7F
MNPFLYRNLKAYAAVIAALAFFGFIMYLNIANVPLPKAVVHALKHPQWPQGFALPTDPTQVWNLLIALCSAIATAIGVSAAFRAAHTNRAWLVPSKIEIAPASFTDPDYASATIQIQNAGNSPAEMILVYARFQAATFKQDENVANFFKRLKKQKRYNQAQPRYIPVLAAHALGDVELHIEKQHLSPTTLEAFGDVDALLRLDIALRYKDLASGRTKDHITAAYFVREQNKDGEWVLTQSLFHLKNDAVPNL